MSAPFTALLIANRGEIAIRIARACADLEIRSVAVFAEDDDASLHTRKADLAVPLKGRGVPAYLDMDQLIAIAAAVMSLNDLHAADACRAGNCQRPQHMQAVGAVIVISLGEVA